MIFTSERGRERTRSRMRKNCDVSSIAAVHSGRRRCALAPLIAETGGINAMIVGGLGVAIPSTVVRRFLRRVSASGAVNLSVPLAA